MRASRAKPRLALCVFISQLKREHGLVFGIQYAQMVIHARLRVCIYPHFFKALGNSAGNDGRVQVGIGTQQGIGARVGHGPFAAAAGLIKLAQNGRAHVRAPVVQLFFQLVLNDLALFLDH